MPVAGGDALFSGFYLNELLMKLLAREDPHPALWDAYAATLAQLGGADEAAALRAFELRLLREIGLLPDLARVTATQAALQPAAAYGVRRRSRRGAASADEAAAITGSDLLALQAALDSDDLRALQRACAGPGAALRRQLRELLAYHLGAAPLRTRQVLLDLQPLLLNHESLIAPEAHARDARCALSVNVNKVALLRNTRHLGIPSVTRAATLCLEAGAQGITVHPRPDERHIRAHDVAELALLLRSWPHAEFNIEGNPFDNLMGFIREHRPQQCTFVPDAPGQFTSDHGFALADLERVAPMVAEANALGVRVSLFMDPEPALMAAVRAIGADRVELYTEPYAAAHGTAGQATQLARYSAAADAAMAVGLGINAGHDLNRANLSDFLRAVPGVQEVSIGHALIADALELGYTETVRDYQRCIQRAYA